MLIERDVGLRSHGGSSLGQANMLRVAAVSLGILAGQLSCAEKKPAPAAKAANSPTPEADWGPLDVSKWESTPHISKRAATEEDVRLGRAVFFLPQGSIAEPLKLPACAIQKEQSGRELPVIVIQAERAAAKVVVGVRYLNGGNGICALEEVQLLSGPDARFK